jgi:hypothetical protein
MFGISSLNFFCVVVVVVLVRVVGGGEGDASLFLLTSTCFVFLVHFLFKVFGFGS